MKFTISKERCIELAKLGEEYNIQAGAPSFGWFCRRCQSDVIDKKCNCTTSPSPWEPKQYEKI
jgi:hypothetical protein